MPKPSKRTPYRIPQPTRYDRLLAAVRQSLITRIRSAVKDLEEATRNLPAVAGTTPELLIANSRLHELTQMAGDFDDAVLHDETLFVVLAEAQVAAGAALKQARTSTA